jgi:hypothetical protein
MSRVSSDEYQNGRLINGYDYDRQAWVKDGRYVQCGHPSSMDCRCYGRVHAGELSKPSLVLSQEVQGILGADLYARMKRL